MSAENIYVLAADEPTKLLAILRETPDLASSQDENGYSLLHAASSYNHLELLKQLVNEFHVDVNLRDEDGETPLFVVETPECAKLLVEELHADITIQGYDGKTAVEKFIADGEFPQVATYLQTKQPGNHTLRNHTAGTTTVDPPTTDSVPRGSCSTQKDIMEQLTVNDEPFLSKERLQALYEKLELIISRRS